MREKFWELPLKQLSQPEWEALCDGCGLCCLIKLEDEDTEEIVYSRLACKLLDGNSCHCKDYKNRKKHVEDCVQLTPDNVGELPWLPMSCAYRRLHEGRGLPYWHYLLSGNRDDVHNVDISVRGKTQSEEIMVELEDAIPYIDEDLGKRSE